MNVKFYFLTAKGIVVTFMDIIVGIENIREKLQNPALTIGNFDGVHLGHKTLFKKVREWAGRLDGQSAVMTFAPHPLEVLQPRNGPAFITLHERKMELIAACGIDVAIVVPFTMEFAQISATDFVEDILVDRIGIRAIIVGYDYRFGKNREGDLAFLERMGERHDFQLEVVSGIHMEGVVVSSTMIRQLIQDGRLQDANRLLGRPYEISGEVVRGRERGGRLLGFPTANIRTASQASPKTGIYAVEVEMDGTEYLGAANLGYNPTFGGDTELSLEVHILDFNDNIYGKPIAVRFIERLRDEKRFSGPGELAIQIRKDVEKAREILEKRRALPRVSEESESGGDFS